MNKLKALRILAGLTQKELSELTGINIKSIRAYEQGRSLNSAAAITVYRLAQALHCEYSELLDVE